MKFNWRANWEILLVLVIIVIGITITTIAAIRNKDKQLLALSEDTDYGQLLAGGKDVALSEAPTDGHTLDPESSHAHPSGHLLTRRPQVQPMTKSTRAPSQQRDAANRGHPHRRSNNETRQPLRYEADAFSGLSKSPLVISEPQVPQVVSTTSAQVSLTTNEAYDALSTEPTPSQLSGNKEPNFNSPPDSNRLTNQAPGLVGRMRQSQGRGGAPKPNKHDHADLTLDEDQRGLTDDIHTTRSSLATNSDQSFLSAVPHGSIPSPQIDQTPATPSLSLHGPYASNHLGQQRAQPPMDSEDMMTSYTRSRLNGTIGDFNASMMSSGEDALHDPSYFSHDQVQNSQYLNAPTGAYHKPFASSLPISVLLTDLIKLARPNPHQATLSAGELPASAKPHQSILQQLRSLPGPLLSLLQKSSSHNRDNDNPTEISLPLSHDASESSQHYHRIAAMPTDFHSILSRSMRSSNILPAFPAPKGTPSQWIPPTLGGTYNPSMNTNADFVASNAAGFIRNGQQPASQASEAQYQSAASRRVQDPYQRQTNDGPAQPADQAIQAVAPPQIVDQPQQDQSQQQAQLDSAPREQQSWAANARGQFTGAQLAPRSPSAGGVETARRLLSPATASAQQQLISRPQQTQYFEGPVPLGYSPPQVALGGQQQVRAAGDYGSMPIESAPKATLSSSPKLASRPAPGGSTLIRSRRSLREDDANQEAERRAQSDEEEYMDQRPLSVVRPDGRPMDSAKLKDFSPGRVQSELEDDDASGFVVDSRPWPPNSRRSSGRRAMYHVEPASEPARRKPTKKSRDRHRDSSGKNTVLEAAGSGLMSKLLGTASTNDELEDEPDDDDETANEKRRDEMDDAEFGISHDERPGKLSSADAGGGADDKGGQADGKQRADSESSVGSGSTDSEAYTRRNLPRADIDFYGHPGEESRQLKYGILGSGNYEVVNGGIYPEADESTAAVNSVANYVRQPGLLLGGFPKLVGAGSQAAFMPGGRLGGFMRGASALPEEPVGFAAPSAGAELAKGPASPFLELYDANGGNLFEPSLLGQLGSSGSSAKSTHASRDEHDQASGAKSRAGAGRAKAKKQSNKSSGGEDSHSVMESHYADEAERARAKGKPTKQSGTRGQGNNQFNSYQISPSKKVTIFSDQDLDSAPSEQLEFRPPDNSISVSR